MGGVIPKIAVGALGIPFNKDFNMLGSFWGVLISGNMNASAP